MPNDPIEQAEAALTEALEWFDSISGDRENGRVLVKYYDVRALLADHKRVVAEAEELGRDARYWKDRYEQQSENLLRVVAERDEFKRLFSECHPIHLDGVKRAAKAEAERDAALEAVANVAGAVQTWEWIPERNDVLAILSASLPPTADNSAKHSWMVCDKATFAEHVAHCGKVVPGE